MRKVGMEDTRLEFSDFFRSSSECWGFFFGAKKVGFCERFDSCLWGLFCHSLFVTSVTSCLCLAGLKLCNVRGKCPNWPNSECWSDGGSNMDRNQHASECKVIVWKAAISHVAALLSYTIAWRSLINHRWPLHCASQYVQMYARYCMFFSIDCIFLDMFIYLQYLGCFCAYFYPTWITTTCAYINTCVSVCRWHVRLSVHVHIWYTECRC